MRDVKEEEIMDEFVIAAADATKSIIDVQRYCRWDGRDDVYGSLIAALRRSSST